MRELDSEHQNGKLHVCMLAYTFYENDNRVTRYAETLLQQGHTVDVISLRTPSQTFCDTDGRLRVIRLQRRCINEKARLTYLLKLLLFSAKSFIVLSLLHLRRPYHLIHVHNVPDFLVFSALVPKLTGSKIILDIHDILPEFYMGKFKTRQESLTYRGLTLVEKMSAMWADHIILANHIWHSRYISRSAKPKKCSVIMNYPNPKLFYPREKDTPNPIFTFIYPGTLSWHQGVDLAVEAFSILSKRTEKCRLEIYGHGSTKHDLVTQIAKLGLEEKIHIHDTVSRSRIASLMASADCGIVPKRSNGFGDEAFSTKIWEFMALGVPVIVSDTTVDHYYFDNSQVLFFKPEDPQDLAEKMMRMMNDSVLRKRLIDRGITYAHNNCWNEKKDLYTTLVDSLYSLEQNTPGNHA